MTEMQSQHARKPVPGPAAAPPETASGESAGAPLPFVAAPPLVPQAPAAMPAAPREVRPLIEARMSHPLHDSAGSWGRIWGATVPSGTTREDLTDPMFFSNKAALFKRGDRIWIRDDADTFTAVLIVRSVHAVGPTGGAPNRAIVHVSDYQSLVAIDTGVDISAYEFSWQGEELAYCVIRRADRKVILHHIADAKTAAKARADLAYNEQKKITK